MYIHMYMHIYIYTWGTFPIMTSIIFFDGWPGFASNSVCMRGRERGRERGKEKSERERESACIFVCVGHIFRQLAWLWI